MKVPVDGKPHLVRIDGKWAVAVGSGGAWHSIAVAALKHAKKLNEVPGDPMRGISTPNARR